MADLSARELEDVQLSFDTFMDKNDELLDSLQLGKFFRALNLNPTLARLEKFDIGKKEGEKKFKFDEVLPMYTELKKEKEDQGTYDDFVQVLKLYDKTDNGIMMVADLTIALTTLGEKLTHQEVEEVLGDCAQENDDGELRYVPFLRRLCGMDPPLKK